MVAYIRHVMALSWANQNFSGQQPEPAPPGCQIIVLTEPSLLVCDCLFVGENPAYYAANFYM